MGDWWWYQVPSRQIFSSRTRKPHANPPNPHASRCANHTHGSQHGCKENVKSALQGFKAIGAPRPVCKNTFVLRVAQENTVNMKSLAAPEQFGHAKMHGFYASRNKTCENAVGRAFVLKGVFGDFSINHINMQSGGLFWGKPGERRF